MNSIPNSFKGVLMKRQLPFKFKKWLNPCSF